MKYKLYGEKCREQSTTEDIMDRHLSKEEKALFAEAVRKDIERAKRRERPPTIEFWPGAMQNMFPEKQEDFAKD